jgi:hypothetical protein
MMRTPGANDDAPRLVFGHLPDRRRHALRPDTHAAAQLQRASIEPLEALELRCPGRPRLDIDQRRPDGRRRRIDMDASRIPRHWPPRP